MSVKRGQDDGFREPCETCGRETPHNVKLEIRPDSTSTETARYSREPYRVATCDTCGEVSVLRMNRL